MELGGQSAEVQWRTGINLTARISFPLFQVGQQQQPADQSQNGPQSQSGLSWSRSSSLRKHLSRRSLSSSRIDQVGDNNAQSNAIKVSQKRGGECIQRCLFLSKRLRESHLFTFFVESDNFICEISQAADKFATQPEQQACLIFQEIRLVEILCPASVWRARHT